MRGKKGNFLWTVAAVVFVIAFVVMLLNSDLEHIEDANGPDDFSLAVITDQDILDGTMGNINFGRFTNSLSGKVTFDSKKFTGVYEVMWTDIMFSTGVTLNLMDFEVNSGNFKMVVVNNGEIIRVIEPGETTVELGAIEGDLSLVVAGESADFSFSMFRSDYDSYSHEG